jgi:hypothetical protein
MIVLCTDRPTFGKGGKKTVVTFPSGDGGAVQIRLTRHQLAALVQAGRVAMHEAFDPPQPDLASVVPLKRNNRAEG